MSYFRTIEISDSRYEFAGLKFVTVKSKNLKGRGDICIFVPRTTAPVKEMPLLILLHGVYGSSWAWAMKAGVHITAQRMIDEGQIKPLAIAMPSDGLWGDGSGYLAHSGYDFEKWIAEDVVEAVKESVPTVNPESSLFISGLSMGGYGAIRIGARYGNKFKGISAHSSITSLSGMQGFVEEPANEYISNNPEVDLIDTILSNRHQLPALRFDCGKADDLITANRELDSRLTAAGIDHSYEESAGAHEWDYWEKNVVKTLLFVSRHS